MHDLGGQLWSRKLSDIVIPGSHDTGTYALPDDPISLIGKAQSEDITSQLNDGIRDFDIRVKFSTGRGTIVSLLRTATTTLVHGILIACSLTLSDIFDQIDTWANLPGHEQEIILVGLSIDKNNGGSQPTRPGFQDCEALGTALGSALLTPSDLEAAGYSADPGQVTLGQLWAMPGHPRVLLSDDTCAWTGPIAGAGTWNPDPPFGSGPGQSFYANQCYADPYDEWWGEQIVMPGIKAQALRAAAETGPTKGVEMTPPRETPSSPVRTCREGSGRCSFRPRRRWACLKSLGGL